MKFFFVVPTLNSSDNLSRLIISLKEQTYSNWRVLFIDGGSNKYNLDKLKNFCNNHDKFNWKKQTDNLDGIYGAMNEGFIEAKENEWLIFWGSDDWAFSYKCLENLFNKINILSKKSTPDLIFCKGFYIDDNNKIVRYSKFNYFINYTFSIFLGSSPPHQAAIFGKGVRKVLNNYKVEYKLAADLDYFINLANYKKLNIQKIDLDFVKIGCGGVSQKKSKLRFNEVNKIYKKRFSFLWIVPFIFRYIFRLITLIKK